jgi:hypothetical protein
MGTGNGLGCCRQGRIGYSIKNVSPVRNNHGVCFAVPFTHQLAANSGTWPAALLSLLDRLPDSNLEEFPADARLESAIGLAYDRPSRGSMLTDVHL